MGKIRIWWADTRGKTLATLLVLWVGAFLVQPQAYRMWVPLTALIGMMVFDGLVAFARKRQWVVTLSTPITGLLIGLVLDPTAGVIPLLTACAVAAITKQVVGVGDHRHIFNPAAMGMLASSVVFGIPVAWWGASWGIAPVFIIAIGMAYVLWKLRRLWMTVLFLCVYFLTIMYTTGFTSAFRLTVDGTVFLFAFIMLDEPITSPSGKIWRYGWGILVGLLVALQSFFPIGALDPLLLALLTANLIGFFFIRKPFATHS